MDHALRPMQPTFGLLAHEVLTAAFTGRSGRSKCRGADVSRLTLGSVPIAPVTACLILASSEGLDHDGAALVERDAWAAIEPLLSHLGGKPRVDDRRVLSGILHRSAKACAGGGCLTHTGPARRSSTGSTGGASAACGRSCSPPSSPARTRPGSPWSTEPRCAPIAPPRAAQGGPEPGDRAVAWRTDNQDPCDRRPAGPDRGRPADAGSGRRHHRCPRPACCDPGTCRSDRRQGLRRRRSQRISHSAKAPAR